ncbi:hypothetical protein E3N88_32206 [Mikania micrantha]|uniref:Uncharacterized protein n=1 Tax=Mikania micrantha TaxID=192012 RepID=A0A5N6M8B4_9ASTR|nr:hypothetical protein E3N88_32206 [Mikania micrantha]
MIRYATLATKEINVTQKDSTDVPVLGRKRKVHKLINSIKVDDQGSSMKRTKSSIQKEMLSDHSSSPKRCYSSESEEEKANVQIRKEENIWNVESDTSASNEDYNEEEDDFTLYTLRKRSKASKCIGKHAKDCRASNEKLKVKNKGDPIKNGSLNQKQCATTNNQEDDLEEEELSVNKKSKLNDVNKNPMMDKYQEADVLFLSHELNIVKTEGSMKDRRVEKDVDLIEEKKESSFLNFIPSRRNKDTGNYAKHGSLTDAEKLQHLHYVITHSSRVSESSVIIGHTTCSGERVYCAVMRYEIQVFLVKEKLTFGIWIEVDYVHGGDSLPNSSKMIAQIAIANLKLNGWLKMMGVCFVLQRKWCGCGDCLLELKRILQEDWLSSLEAKREFILNKFKIEQPNIMTTSFTTVARHILKQPIEKNQMITAFIIHLPEKKVLDQTSGLSWEPTVMWRALCEHVDPNVSSKMSQVKAIDCLLVVRLKLVHGNFSKGSFTRHCDEFISALPFQAYTDPRAGFLNLAVKLPPAVLKPDLGQRHILHMEWLKKLGKRGFRNKLHCEMSDADNIGLRMKEKKNGALFGCAAESWLRKMNVL